MSCVAGMIHRLVCSSFWHLSFHQSRASRTFANIGIGGDGGGAFPCGAAGGDGGGGLTGCGGSAAAVPTGGEGAVQVGAFATGCATLSDVRFGSVCGNGSSHASIADVRITVNTLFGALLLLAGILLDLRC